MPADSKTLKSSLRYYLPPLLWLAVVFLGGRLLSPHTYAHWVRSALGLFLPPASLTYHLVTTVATDLWNSAHVPACFVLSCLVWRALRAGRTELWRWGWASWTLAIIFVLAVADETQQYLGGERHAQLSDVGLDLLGALLALAVLKFYAWKRGRLEVAA